MGECRLCAKQTDGLLPIFDKPDVQKTSQLLFIITGVRISIDDLLPLNICQQCKNFVDKSRIFRYKCLKAQEVLESKQNITKVKKRKIIKKESEENDTDGQNVNDSEQKDLDSCDDDNRTTDLSKFLKINIKLKPGHTVCQHCGKHLNKNLLQRHLRAKHGYEKIHKCSYCDYKGADQYVTRMHERMHTGERPHVCSTCGAAFMSNGVLTQHMGTHLTERNFLCDECPAQLKSKRRLQQHKNSHKQENYNFKCYLCDKIFTKRLYTTDHIKKFHKEKPDYTRIVKFDKYTGDIRSNDHLSKWHPSRKLELESCQEQNDET